MGDKEIEAIAEAVLHKILNAPSGVEVTLRGPEPGKSFSTLLPGVPRAGEVLWHCSPNRNSAPKPFVVRRVEWFNVWPDLRADVFLGCFQKSPSYVAKYALLFEKEKIKGRGKRHRASPPR
jgi:hypothetical protein